MTNTGMYLVLVAERPAAVGDAQVDATERMSARVAELRRLVQSGHYLVDARDLALVLLADNRSSALLGDWRVS